MPALTARHGFAAAELRFEAKAAVSPSGFSLSICRRNVFLIHLPMTKTDKALFLVYTFIFTMLLSPALMQSMNYSVVCVSCIVHICKNQMLYQCLFQTCYFISFYMHYAA